MLEQNQPITTEASSQLVDEDISSKKLRLESLQKCCLWLMYHDIIQRDAYFQTPLKYFLNDDKQLEILLQKIFTETTDEISEENFWGEEREALGHEWEAVAEDLEALEIQQKITYARQGQRGQVY